MRGLGERATLDVRRLAVGLLVPAALIVGAQAWASSRSGSDTASTAAADPSAARAGFRTAGEPKPRRVTGLPVGTKVTIAATGEFLIHPSIVDHAARHGDESGRSYDFGALFEELRRPLATSDLSICHLEVPVAPPGSALSGYPVFGIPAEIADGIRDTGWDRCSTASNHSNDRGTAGIKATLNALDGRKVGQSGMARNRKEATTSPIVEANGVPVAHLSYTWGFNGEPPEEPWMVNVIDRKQILADAREAKRDGAELVVLSLHWGDEYDRLGNDAQRRLAKRLLSRPEVDLIIGHGPHVLQPIVEYHGKFALLSVGNLIANQGLARADTYDGIVAKVTFTLGEDGTFQSSRPTVRATWYDRDAGEVRLVHTALDGPASTSLEARLRGSRDRVIQTFGNHVRPRPTR